VQTHRATPRKLEEAAWRVDCKDFVGRSQVNQQERRKSARIFCPTAKLDSKTVISAGVIVEWRLYGLHGQHGQ
jgi:hypothetical protein